MLADLSAKNSMFLLVPQEIFFQIRQNGKGQEGSGQNGGNVTSCPIIH